MVMIIIQCNNNTVNEEEVDDDYDDVERSFGLLASLFIMEKRELIALRFCVC